MKRLITALAVVTAAATAGAGGAAGQPAGGSPASCAGFLASNANPNNGFVIQEIVQPAAAALGVPMGAVQSSLARHHGETLVNCIP